MTQNTIIFFSSRNSKSAKEAFIYYFVVPENIHTHLKEPVTGNSKGDDSEPKLEFPDQRG